MTLPLPYSNVTTSKAAAQSMVTAAAIQLQRVYDFLCVADAADFQIRDTLGIAYCSVNARRRSLVKAGYVKDSGKRLKTPTGREAIVWEITHGQPLDFPSFKLANAPDGRKKTLRKLKAQIRTLRVENDRLRRELETRRVQ